MENPCFISTSLGATISFGASLANRVFLRPEWSKVILLSGQLGTGKTTLARGFFEELGTRNVKSPTFTYFQEYELSGDKIVHGDLYRLQDDPASKNVLLQQLEEYVQAEHILLLEWSDILSKEHMLKFFPQHIALHLEPGDDESSRKISIQFHTRGSISESKVRALMDEFHTPVHVRTHIEKVTAVAYQIAKNLFKNGIFLDTELVKNAALCHDLVRYVDFPDFDDLSHYQEEITLEKLEFWKAMHKKYSGAHHGQAIGDILRDREFPITAQVAESHMTRDIFREEPFSWEEKIVYYADKRVLHDTVVSLAKRFEDGRRRYGHEASSDLEKKVFLLEKEIFSHLSITPEDIK